MGATLIRFATIAAALAVLFLFLSAPFAELLAPAFRLEIAWLDNTFRVDRVYVDQDGSDKVFRIDVGLAKRLVLNGHVVNPDPRGTATASTLVGHAIVPTILMLAVAFAWPAGKPITHFWRILCLVPTVILLWAIDVPSILLASLWGLVLQALDPGRFSSLRIWSVFLQSGGELALAIVLGTLIAALIKERPQSINTPR